MLKSFSLAMVVLGSGALRKQLDDLLRMVHSWAVTEREGKKEYSLLMLMLTGWGETVSKLGSGAQGLNCYISGKEAQLQGRERKGEEQGLCGWCLLGPTGSQSAPNSPPSLPPHPHSHLLALLWSIPEPPNFQSSLFISALLTVTGGSYVITHYRHSSIYTVTTSVIILGDTLLLFSGIWR